MTVLQGFLTEHDGYDDSKVQQCAEGVLVGLKRCTVQAASGEIDQVARRHRLDIRRVAQALIRLAQNVEAEVDSNATAVARFEWGALVAGRRRP
ncbi:ANTAR domain-containing protein [Mycolicibacterium sp. P1-5]|uniref:ANTAR domain-containing protein n=1 Tax=Mycolicibacterium sp. P1-5 TaxID=2024617 RepID=UPI0018833683|nr:ANTAR domain-containing protein [Mycolicibacterium sp. P1-5]